MKFRILDDAQKEVKMKVTKMTDDCSTYGLHTEKHAALLRVTHNVTGRYKWMAYT